MTALRFFGKLPAHGDFIARGVDRRLQEELDGWLSHSLEAARSADPKAFPGRYDSAPPWFMRVADEGQGEEAVLMASIDAVARRFPLLVAHPLVPGMEPGRLAAALGEIAREAILAGWDADRLAATPIMPDAGRLYTDPPDAADAIWWIPETERHAMMQCAGRRPPELINAMLLLGDSIR